MGLVVTLTAETVRLICLVYAHYSIRDDQKENKNHAIFDEEVVERHTEP